VAVFKDSRSSDSSVLSFLSSILVTSVRCAGAFDAANKLFKLNLSFFAADMVSGFGVGAVGSSGFNPAMILPKGFRRDAAASANTLYCSMVLIAIAIGSSLGFDPWSDLHVGMIVLEQFCARPLHGPVVC
jgi:hypothetical protein